MNAMRIIGIMLTAMSVLPVLILLRVYGNVRRELSEAGIREPELTLRTLSGLGGVTGVLLVSGCTLALIGGVLLAVFA